jgi:hypothetical protein
VLLHSIPFHSMQASILPPYPLSLSLSLSLCVCLCVCLPLSLSLCCSLVLLLAPSWARAKCLQARIHACNLTLRSCQCGPGLVAACAGGAGGRGRRGRRRAHGMDGTGPQIRRLNGIKLIEVIEVIEVIEGWMDGWIHTYTYSYGTGHAWGTDGRTAPLPGCFPHCPSQAEAGGQVARGGGPRRRVWGTRNTDTLPFMGYNEA